jgi:hypothetical protein
MSTKPPAPSIRSRIIGILVTLLIVGPTLWLFFRPPAAFAPYQTRFYSAIDFFFGLWFLACSLFYHARFAKAIGTGPSSPLARWFGPKVTRLFFLIVGLFMLTIVGINVLLHRSF